jgi:hypothetical protein
VVLRQRDVERVVEDVLEVDLVLVEDAARVVHEHEVELAGLQPRDALHRVGLGQRQLHAGVLPAESRDRLRHERGAGGGEGAQAQASAAQARDGLQLGLGVGQAGEDAVRVADQRLTGVGEPDPARIALDEGGAGLALEGGDLLRDGRLRVAELRGRGRERALCGDLSEDLHPLDVEHKGSLSATQGTIV